MKRNILIIGGTGFIGQALSQRLSDRGDNIIILTRKDIDSDYQKMYIKNINERDLFYDVAINLSGAPIAQYWTNKNKQEIYNSRINVTKDLVNFFFDSTRRPNQYICASAIGYYGNDNNEYHEESRVRDLGIFSQKLCHDLEKEADKLQEKTQIVKLRLGVVLGKEGGALKKMIAPFKMGLGGFMGNGSQYMSWVHIDDVVRAIEFIIEKNLNGSFNIVAPNATTNKDFSKNLAKLLRRPCLLNMPSIIAKIIFGQMGQELLLTGQKVIPKKLIDNGFKFEFENIDQALRNIIE